MKLDHPPGRPWSGRRVSVFALAAVVLPIMAASTPAWSDEQCAPDLEDPSFSDVAEGLSPGSRTGAALSSAGDLDLDGIADWVVGAPAYETDESPVEAGAAFVYLGSPDPARRTSPAVIFVGAEAHDRAGVSVKSGFDFDGDGMSDLLIGAEQVNRSGDDDLEVGCDSGESCGPGKVYLIYFKSSDYDLVDPDPDVVNLNTVGMPGGVSGVVLTGVVVGDRAGFAVDGGGRVNDDAVDDIAIGAPGRETSGGSEAGTVYVVFGDPLLSGSVSLDRVASLEPDGLDGVVYEGAMAGDNLGHAVAFPGDVVGSDGPDLVMGAPGADYLAPDAGTVYGAAGGNMKRDTIEACDLGGGNKPGFQLHGTQPGERLGFSVAGGGDSIANGQQDLLMGAPGFDSGAALDVGRVVQTAAKIPTRSLAIDSIGAPSGEPDAQQGIRYVGGAAGDGLGSAVAGVGDVTGNESEHILLGAPFADRIGAADVGAVYLRSGFTPDSFHLGTVNLTAGFPGVTFTGTEAGELSGSAVAGAGDSGGDGLDDFLVGSPGSTTDPGQTVIVFDQPDDCGSDSPDSDGGAQED